MTASKAPCHCAAYPFPHRAGGGKCQHESSYLCSACQQPCDTCWLDFRPEHKDPLFSSTCCEADVLTNDAKRSYCYGELP